MTKRPTEASGPNFGPDADFSALSHLAPELAATLAAVASDIALVVDPDGRIRNVAVSGGASPVPAAADWVGRQWADTVTDETRRKVELLLAETKERGVSQRREVTLRCASGTDVPVAYTAILLGQQGPLLAVGRDLRAIAAIQQRFVESQQQMERDYWRRRQAEARYRQLFQVATEAVLVVDALSHQIVEANRAAGDFFALKPSALAGRIASAGFTSTARSAVEDLLGTAHSHGRAAEIRVRIEGRPFSVSATPFQSDGVPQVLLRIRAADSADGSEGGLGRLIELVERTPDAIVVTDAGGHIRTVNPAFLALCNLPPDVDLAGRALGEWIGQAPREAHELIESVRKHGITAPLLTRLRGLDRAIEVELTAVLLPEGDQDSIGFTLRRRVPRSVEEEALFDDLARAVERLSTRLGSLRLPSLMREGTDLIERHLLQTALARSADDAGAAELLGISADSLILRLRRHGLRPGGSLPAITS